MTEQCGRHRPVMSAHETERPGSPSRSGTSGGQMKTNVTTPAGREEDLNPPTIAPRGPGTTVRGPRHFPGQTCEFPTHGQPTASTAPETQPLRAAHAGTYAKTPHSAFQLVAGSLGTSSRVPPAGFEPAHTAPEAA
ncbi:hypothetical protein GCM10010104_36570 [Streptomyces indiaensis]|uniref:Uncharacterized protein n=1 Tax=Streptomyces indiaensis TaxID=284033 RepID=A0ABN3DP96_9ACTN